MQHIIHQHARPGNCQGNRFGFLLVGALTAFSMLVPVAFTGCSSAQVAKVESAAKVIYQDATSAAGQKLLADVTSAGFTVGLDIVAGNEPGAVIAGIQGAASAMRDYEGLPVAPSSATIASVAASGAGVSQVALTLNSSLGTIIDNAKKTAAQQHVTVSTDDIIEALATGFDGVAAVKGA